MEVWVAVRQFSLNLFSGTFLMVVPVVLLHSVEMFVVCLFVLFLTVSSSALLRILLFSLHIHPLFFLLVCQFLSKTSIKLLS